MKICMISSEFPPVSGGVGYYVYNLSKKIVERGHNVTILTAARSSRQMKKEIKEGITVIRVPFLPLYPFHVHVLDYFIQRAFTPLESHFELVHAHSPMPLPINTFLPILTTVHTPMIVDGRFHEVVDFPSLGEKVQSLVTYPPLELKLFKASQMLSSVSLAVAKELSSYGISPLRVRVVGNGVDEKTFIPNPDLRNKAKYVLYTGILRGRKGLFDFVACAERVCKVSPDVKFVICGGGPLLNSLKQKVERLGLGNRVVFLGRVSRSHLIQVYQNATIHVVPSHYEGLPTVLLEGMACGLPIVATDIGGINEVVTSGSNGILVPSKSPELLANQVLYLLNDPELRKKLGTAARNTIEDHYTWKKTADRILECYEEVLN